MNKLTPLPDPRPAETTCPKCGWSLLTSGMSAEAHAVVCGGLGTADPGARLPPAQPTPPEK